MKNNIFIRRVAIVLVFALLVTSTACIGNVNKAQAAVTAGNVVYEGNGSLSCGSATLTLKDGILTYTGATTIKYWDNPVAGTMVTNQNDKLSHVFWYGGIYKIIDMNTGAIIQAYKNSQNSYCIKSSGTAVYGSSAYMATINTCIIDDEWFYQEGMAKMQHLMTRAEFDSISNGQDPTAPTPTPTVAPTQEPTIVPTVEPTVAPTQEPTVAPTQVPTEAPSVAPTQQPTPVATPMRTPDIESDTHIEFDIKFWWEQYKAGKITWEQFTSIVWEHQWKIDTQETEKETTYFFYDEKGNLIRTERILISNGTQTGTGSGSAQVENAGKAEYTETTTGKGEVTGTVDANTKVYMNSTTAKTKASKTKITYNVKRKGKKVKLTRTVSGKTGVICTVTFNKKKKFAKFDGITYKNIKYVGYTAKSRQIVMIKKNGKVLIVPRAKGKVRKTYTARIINGKWKYGIENPSGLTIRVSNGVSKVKGVKDATPKRI